MQKKLLIIGFLLLAALLLSGCTGSTAWPGLATDGENVYLANGQFVHSFSLKDGSQNWQYPLQASKNLLFYSNPVAAPNGLVIFGSVGVEHTLFAINPTKFPQGQVQSVNGFQRFLCSIGLATCPEYKVEEWVFNGAKDHWVASQLVLNNKVFAPNADGNLYILDLNSGSLIKKIAFSGDSGSANRLWGQPVTDGKHIFLTSLDRSVFAIDAETYEVVWKQNLTGAIPGGAAIGSDGMLYAGSLAKQLERFDPETGKHEPVLNTNGWIWGTPAVDGDNLYFGDVDGYIYSYNTKDGKPNWEKPDKLDDEITATPLVRDNDVLVATKSGNIYSINKADGTFKVWREGDKKGKAYTTPVASGDLVLVAYLETDYILVAVDQNGNKQWTYPLGK